MVTANKALIAAHADELSEAAEKAGKDLFFEAAVAAAIPVVGYCCAPWPETRSTP